MAAIEYLVLANHAEAANNLLYLSGAGWTDSWRGEVPEGATIPTTRLGIGVSILVPWTETNKRHHLTILVEGEDGGQELARVDGDFEVGRPTGLPSGSDQRTVLALNAEIAFPRPAGYRIVGELAGERKTVSFRVHDAPKPLGR